MKKVLALLCIIVGILTFSGCDHRSMNYIIEHEPSITGTVKEVQTEYITICLNTEAYPVGTECTVSLNVENEDSITHFNIGDEVTVYYDGTIAETYPLQINTVYAITLLTPAERDQNAIS